jgi:phage tail-like protein
MARAQSTDFLQVFRFKVYTGQPDFLGPDGGFSACSMPTLDVGVAEYKEGTWRWKRKYPGIPTVGDVTLSKGVARKDTRFYDWIMAAINGQEYRTDVKIEWYTREGVLSKEIILKEAFPSSVRLGGDFAADADDISISEITIVAEEIEYKDNEAS